VTAGTLFDRRRTPLTVWFAACWMFASQKDGISAQSLQRGFEIGSYPTAWAMLHRLRSVLVHPGRDRLSGTVEVDETYFGGEEPGLRGGRQKGKKVLVGVAVELREPRGFGRCRLSVLTDASAVSLERFVTENIEEGSTLVTDAWPSYPPAVRDRYAHKPINVKRSGQPAHVVLPGVHRVASLAKPWVAGTHQGRFDEAHLQSYLDEFTFGSIAGDRGVEGSSSTACSNSPWATIRCASDSSSLTRARRRCHQRHPSDGGIHRASTGPVLTGHGEQPTDQGKWAQMNIPWQIFARAIAPDLARRGRRRRRRFSGYRGVAEKRCRSPLTVMYQIEIAS